MLADTVRHQEPLKGNIFHRDRLLRLLQENGRRLVLICGRPGQGKSILISDFLKGKEGQKLWWNLAEEDGESRLFLQRLQGLACGHEAGSSDEQGAELALSGIVERLFKREETCLVMDNFEAVAAKPAIREIIQNLVPLLPEGASLILISDLLLDFFFYRHRKDIFLLSDSMLGFDLQDLRRLVSEHYELKLSDAELGLLWQLTGGWVFAAIHLCETMAHLEVDQQRLLLNTFLQSSRLPDLDAVFHEKVLLSLGEAQRTALLRASCLEPADDAALDALVGPLGQEVLTELGKSGWFVSPPSAETSAFRFDPLFASFLRGRLRAQKDEETKRFVRSVAERYVTDGRPLQAVKHFLACGLVDEAEKAFLSQADELIRSGSYQTVREHLRRFPEASLKSSRRLEYCRVVVSILDEPLALSGRSRELIAFFSERGEYHRAARLYSGLLVAAICFNESRETASALLSEAEKFLAQAKGSLPPPDVLLFQSWLFLAEWWILRFSQEDLDLVLQAEEESLKLRNEEVLLFAKMVMARIHVDRGEFDQALHLLEANQRLVEKTSANQQYRPCYQLQIADTLYLVGKLEESLEVGARELARIEAGNPFIPHLCTNQLYCQLLKLDLEAAERTLDQFREFYKEADTDFKDLIIYQGQMLLSYLAKDPRKSKFYGNRILSEGNRHLLILDFPWVKLNIGEVKIFLAEYKEAELLLDELIREAPEERFPYCAASAYALLAILHSRLKAEEQAKYFAGEAKRIIAEKAFRNLEICNPELLQEFSEICGDATLSRFHRLKSQELAEQGGEASPELQFLVLGGLRIFINGKEIPNSEYARKKRMVDFLKLLVVHRGRGIPKEVIFEKFWPGYQADSCRDSLNTLVFRTKRLLGSDRELIVSDADSVCLKADELFVDADEFLRLKNLGNSRRDLGDLKGALRCYARASELYKGHFLENDLYIDEINNEREFLKREYARLLFQAVKACLEQMDNLRAQEYARKLIELDPCAESGYRLMMIVIARLGDRSDLFRYYRQLTEQLQRNFSIAVDKKTSDLLELLLRGAEPIPGMWRSEVYL